MKRLLAALVGVTALTGCVGHTTASTPTRPAVPVPQPDSTPASSSPAAAFLLPESPQADAELLYSRQGHGSAVIVPQLGSGKVYTVRFLCVGEGAPVLRSVGGGMIMRTDGCMANEVFGASFTRTSKLDPSKLTLSVAPGVAWALEVWAGKYVTPPAVTPSA
jgi:hypothetical protein